MHLKMSFATDFRDTQKIEIKEHSTKFAEKKTSNKIANFCNFFLQLLFVIGLWWMAKISSQQLFRLW